MASSRTLLIVSIILAVGGGGLLSWFGWVMFNVSPPPYYYQLLAEGGVDAFPSLDLKTQPGISIRKYALRITDIDQPLATFHVGERDIGDTGAVLLDWQNQIDEALITITPPITELPELIAAVADHVPKEAVVLGWWDTTRRLKLLAGIETPFRENLAQPILIPDAWNDRRDKIEEIERRFWGLRGRKDASRVSFSGFQEALLADTATGAAKLRALAGEHDAYLVLHTSDAYKLSTMHPQRLGVGYREFPNTGNLHGMISHIKKWLQKQGYKDYAVERSGGTLVRVYFLTDALSTKTLIAQALPFTSSQPLRLEDITVVYQHGGYWVYKIQSKTTGNNT